MRSIARAVATGAFLLAATGAAAQSGGILVIVLDAAGQPLQGAVVTVDNAMGYVKAESRTTDARGEALFPVLRAGSGYSIRVSFPGMSTIREDGLHVRLSEVQPLTVHMIAAHEEQVRVVERAEPIDIAKSESTTRFTDEFISDLPVAGRFYTNLLVMAPGVLDANDDGNPNVHGSRGRDFRAEVAGVSHVDPLTGQNFGRLNLNSIEEMEVITSGASPEFGRAQGGFARVIQKQGNNWHEGVVEFYWRTSQLDGDGAEDAGDFPDQEFDSYQPSFQFTGPLQRDRLWYRASYERIDDEVPINVLSGIEIFESVRETIDTQLTWQVSPRNKLALVFRGDPEEAQNWGISSRVQPASSQALDRDVETWSLNWTAAVSSRVLVESTVAWQDINSFQGPSQNGIRNDCVPNAQQAFIHSAYCNDLSRNAVSGSWYRTRDDQRQRLTVRGRATVFGGRLWGVTHQVKLGLQVENERYFRYLEERPAITYEIVSFLGGSSEETATFEQFGRVVSGLSVPEQDDVRATGTNWGLHFEDQIKPRSNVTISFGGRIDREEINSEGRDAFDPAAELRGYAGLLAGLDPACAADSLCYSTAQQEWVRHFTGYENIAGFEGQLVDILCEPEAGESAEASCATLVQQEVLSQNTNDLLNKRKATSIHLDNTNLSPFLALGWAPWADGKTAFKATLGRYYNNIPLLVPLQELNPVRTTVEYRASLVAPEDCPPPGEEVPSPSGVACGQTRLVGGINPLLSIFTVDRDLQTPYQDEFTLKVERQLWRETTLGLTYVNRRYRDQIQDVNVNTVAGDLGRCNRQTSFTEAPVVAHAGRTLGVCSVSPVACIDDAGCPPAERCGYDLYFVDPAGFCEIAGDCLSNEFSYPAHVCQQGVDPYCGTPFPDMNPGLGDGYVDPLTGFVDGDGDGFADDNCSGETIIQLADPAIPGCNIDGDPFGSNCTFIRRPDNLADLYLQNPFWGDVFLIGNVNEIDYEAWVLELVRRQYRGWEMAASYTWSEAQGDGEDFFQELGDDPTLRANVFGYQSYDQTHVVKTNATTITPWGIRLGTAVTWQSGLPYSLLTEELSFDTKPPITDLFGGQGDRPRQTYPTGARNDQRNASFWNVDLRAAKELRLGRRMSAQLSAEVFNLLDDGTYQIYNPFLERGVQINGENEAQRRFGRRWQMGLRFAF